MKNYVLNSYTKILPRPTVYVSPILVKAKTFIARRNKRRLLLCVLRW